MKKQFKCKKHPKYKGVLRPRCNCKDCEFIYNKILCFKNK